MKEGFGSRMKVRLSEMINAIESAGQYSQYFLDEAASGALPRAKHDNSYKKGKEKHKNENEQRQNRGTSLDFRIISNTIKSKSTIQHEAQKKRC